MAFERDPDLPDGLFDGGEETRPADIRDHILGRLGNLVVRKRDEAVDARRASGIEAVWQACEEAYLCIDDLNRHEAVGSGKWIKSMTTTGPVQRASSKPEDGRSTAFVRLTARYVDMAAAKLSEMVLPIDERAFKFSATPVPDPVDPSAIQAAATPQQMGMPGQPSMPGAMPQVQPPAMTTDLSETSKAAKDVMAEYAERAEQRIYDWMTEANYPAQMRRVIKDSARIGVGVLKGPFPEERKRRAISRKDGVVTFEKVSKVVPSYKRIDPWNLFPHKACGEDIHSGDYVIERDLISAASLRALKDKKDLLTGSPIYLPGAIDMVLDQGPNGHKVENRNGTDEAREKDRFEIWYYTGTVSREDLGAACGMVDDLPESLTDIPAIVSIVNDRVIGAIVNPSQDGGFPYRTMPWTPREGHWAGVGVAEQVSMAQKTVNASTRAVFNNAGVSSGVQIVIDQEAIEPADGSRTWTITPNKIWLKKAGSVDDVRKAFMSVEIPNLTAQLMPIIEYGFRMAEEASNIPLISQGQTGPQDPQTFGQAELLNSNGNSLMRHLAYTLDDNITEPVVQDSYEWLLLDPDVPEEEKGDWEINARGSIAMVEKAIQEVTLMQVGALVVNPAFGLSPSRWAELMLKSKRIDPRLVQLTEEEKAAMANQPPPEAPAVTAANINAQARIQAAQISAGVTQTRIQVDTDRDAAYVQAETERTRSEHEARMAELQVKRELAMLDYANKRTLSLEEVKASLAETAMKLQVQKDLSLAAHVANASGKERDRQAAKETSKPPTEPAGRAPVGQSYQA